MAGNFLPAAKLTASRPVLNPGEVECSLLSAVDVLSDDLTSFPDLKFGLLILTTPRLLFLPQESTTDANSGSHYVPLSAIRQIFSAKKSLKSMFHSPRIRFQVGATLDGKITENGAQNVVITLVLRGKTDPDSFLGKFWDAWVGKDWEASGSASGSVSGERSG